MTRTNRKNLTPIEDNWEELDRLHFGSKDKYGEDAGFDSGFFFMSEEHTLEIAVIEGHEWKKGRKGMKVKHTKSRYLLAQFCPFTGRPLYEESVPLPVSSSRKIGVQTTLF